MICAVVERSPGLVGGQKEHQAKLVASDEVKVELKF